MLQNQNLCFLQVLLRLYPPAMKSFAPTSMWTVHRGRTASTPLQPHPHHRWAWPLPLPQCLVCLEPWSSLYISCKTLHLWGNRSHGCFRVVSSWKVTRSGIDIRWPKRSKAIITEFLLDLKFCLYSLIPFTCLGCIVQCGGICKFRTSFPES